MNTGTIVANERLTTFRSLLKKTLKRSLKFQEERYLSSDTVYTLAFVNSFMVKAKCRASMSTRKIHELEDSLDVTSGNVREAHCTCRDGKSRYCSHVMSLLLELARYSLEDFDRIPEEAACTSTVSYTHLTLPTKRIV